MSVKIRLRRTGARNSPSYRVVAADTRFPRDGRFLEILGWYDPKRQGPNCSLKLERIDHWLSKGARPSDTVRSLMKKARAAGAQDAAETTAEEAAKAEPAQPAAPAEAQEAQPAEPAAADQATPAEAQDAEPAEAEAAETTAEKQNEPPAQG
jgi:small subunit ribosomal protein S16